MKCTKYKRFILTLHHDLRFYGCNLTILKSVLLLSLYCSNTMHPTQVVIILCHAIGYVTVYKHGSSVT